MSVNNFIEEVCNLRIRLLSANNQLSMAEAGLRQCGELKRMLEFIILMQSKTAFKIQPEYRFGDYKPDKISEVEKAIASATEKVEKAREAEAVALFHFNAGVEALKKLGFDLEGS